MSDENPTPLEDAPDPDKRPWSQLSAEERGERAGRWAQVLLWAGLAAAVVAFVIRIALAVLANGPLGEVNPLVRDSELKPAMQLLMDAGEDRSHAKARRRREDPKFAVWRFRGRFNSDRDYKKIFARGRCPTAARNASPSRYLT